VSATFFVRWKFRLDSKFLPGFPVTSGARWVVAIQPCGPFVSFDITVEVTMSPFRAAPRDFIIGARVENIILTDETFLCADAGERSTLSTIVHLCDNTGWCIANLKFAVGRFHLHIYKRYFKYVIQCLARIGYDFPFMLRFLTNFRKFC